MKGKFSLNKLFLYFFSLSVITVLNLEAFVFFVYLGEF